MSGNLSNSANAYDRSTEGRSVAAGTPTLPSTTDGISSSDRRPTSKSSRSSSERPSLAQNRTQCVTMGQFYQSNGLRDRGHAAGGSKVAHALRTVSQQIQDRNSGWPHTLHG